MPPRSPGAPPVEILAAADAVGANDNLIPVFLPPDGNAMANDFLDSGEELCDDGIDNDFDGDTDCDDSFCRTLPLCTAPAPVMSFEALGLLVAFMLLVAAWGFGRGVPGRTPIS